MAKARIFETAQFFVFAGHKKLVRRLQCLSVVVARIARWSEHGPGSKIFKLMYRKRAEGAAETSRKMEKERG